VNDRTIIQKLRAALARSTGAESQDSPRVMYIETPIFEPGEPRHKFSGEHPVIVLNEAERRAIYGDDIPDDAEPTVWSPN
jgi:hypothetical protein